MGPGTLGFTHEFYSFLSSTTSPSSFSSVKFVQLVRK